MAKQKKPKLMTDEFIMCLSNILTPGTSASEEIRPVFTLLLKGSEDKFGSLIYWHRKLVKAQISYAIEPEKAKDKILVEGQFEVLAPTLMPKNTGDMIKMVLKAAYEKTIHLQLVQLYKNDCKISLEEMERQIDFEDEPGEEGRDW
jgi:hypothetical protein